MSAVKPHVDAGCRLRAALLAAHCGFGAASCWFNMILYARRTVRKKPSVRSFESLRMHMAAMTWLGATCSSFWAAARPTFRVPACRVQREGADMRGQAVNPAGPHTPFPRFVQVTPLMRQGWAFAKGDGIPCTLAANVDDATYMSALAQAPLRSRT